MPNEQHMRRAIELARRGQGWTSPNPLVGAVLVRDGRTIGEGWHRRAGSLHAEREALRSCTEDPRGAVMYVTLEPCCHHGKQPPCTEALIECGISRVVIGSSDPNPLVSGKGVARLRDAGIDVVEGFLREACDALNPAFFHHVQTGMPYVALKYAMTADGKICTRTGASRWITGPEARDHVHQLRRRYRGIMVGIGTVLADDPLLTCRIPNARDPLRIVCDTHARTPVESRLCQTADRVETIVAVGPEAPAGACEALETRGISVLRCPLHEGRVDVRHLMRHLGEQGVDGILLEGGATLAYSAFSAGVVSAVHAYVAPKVFGGTAAKTPVAGLGVGEPDDAFPLSLTDVERFGDDVLLTYQAAAKGSRKGDC